MLNKAIKPFACGSLGHSALRIADISILCRFGNLWPEAPVGQTKKPPTEAAFSIAAAHQAAIDPKPTFSLPEANADSSEEQTSAYAGRLLGLGQNHPLQLTAYTEPYVSMNVCAIR